MDIRVIQLGGLRRTTPEAGGPLRVNNKPPRVSLCRFLFRVEPSSSCLSFAHAPSETSRWPRERHATTNGAASMGGEKPPAGSLVLSSLVSGSGETKRRLNGRQTGRDGREAVPSNKQRQRMRGQTSAMARRPRPWATFERPRIEREKRRRMGQNRTRICDRKSAPRIGPGSCSFLLGLRLSLRDTKRYDFLD